MLPVPDNKRLKILKSFNKYFLGVFSIIIIWILPTKIFAQAPVSPTYDIERIIRETSNKAGSKPGTGKFDAQSWRDTHAGFKKATKRFDENVWRYIYTVYMKNGDELKANSKIFRDNTTGKYFLYYVFKDSVTQIFSNETIRLSRQNPYKSLPVDVAGVVVNGCWRFQLIGGKINGFASFYKNIELDEAQIAGGEVVPIESEQIKLLLQTNKKAYTEYLNKHYYRALMIYNDK